MIITLKTLQNISKYPTQEPILQALNDKKLTHEQYGQMINWWQVLRSKEFTPDQIFANEQTTSIPDPKTDPKEVIII